MVTSAMLRTWAVRLPRHDVDALGQILPHAADIAHLRLAAELAVGADLAGDAGDFGGEAAQLIDHGVDRFLELEDLAAHVDGDLFRQVAVGHGDGDVGDAAHLGGQVAGHEVDVVGQVFPGAGDAGNHGLAAELAVGADLAGDAGDFGGEAAQLIDHGVDRVFKLQNFAFGIDGDLFRQVAAGDGDGDVGDVSDLGGQVAGHRVDAVGQVLPGAGDAGNHGLAAELAVGADLAGDASDFGGEAAELIDHGIDRFFELENLAAHVDGDLFRQVAVGHGDGDVGDAAYLGGQVAGHHVDVVGQIFPRSGDPRHVRLAAELAFGADLAGDAGDFAGEGVELLHHGVDHFRRAQKLAAQRLAFGLHRHGLGKIAFGDRADDARHFGCRADQVFDQIIDGVDAALP